MGEVNKIVSLLMVSIVVLCSCSEDKVSTDKLLRKTVEISENGTSITTLYNYNGNEIVSVDGAKKYISYTYTDGLITKIITKDKESQWSVTLDYTYNKAQLVRMYSSEGYVMNYSHKGDGTVSYEKVVLDSQNQETKVFHGILYFENWNLVKDERIFDDSPQGVLSKQKVSFEYDSKNNPFYNILGYAKLLSHNEVISINNNRLAVVERVVIQDDQLTSSANLYQGVFKYDTDNYPVEHVTEASIVNPNYVKTQFFY